MDKKIGTATAEFSPENPSTLTVEVKQFEGCPPIVCIGSKKASSFVLIFSPEQARQIIDALETSITECWGGEEGEWVEQNKI